MYHPSWQIWYYSCSMNRGNYFLEIMQTCALKLVVRQMSFFLLATPFLLLHIAWPLKLLTMPSPYTASGVPLSNLNVLSFTEGGNKCRQGGNAKVGRQAGNHEMNRKSGRCYIGTTPTEPHDSNMPNVRCYNQSSIFITISVYKIHLWRQW